MQRESETQIATKEWMKYTSPCLGSQFSWPEDQNDRHMAKTISRKFNMKRKLGAKLPSIRWVQHLPGNFSLILFVQIIYSIETANQKIIQNASAPGVKVPKIRFSWSPCKRSECMNNNIQNVFHSWSKTFFKSAQRALPKCHPIKILSAKSAKPKKLFSDAKCLSDIAVSLG